jgi:Putative transmembrane family 234
MWDKRILYLISKSTSQQQHLLLSISQQLPTCLTVVFNSVTFGSYFSSCDYNGVSEGKHQEHYSILFRNDTNCIMSVWWSADLFSMILVGALWGCTNPLLRKGSLEEKGAQNGDKNDEADSNDKTWSLLRSFLRFQVWLPYALNQSGSIVFYILLAKSDLSMAVPICNAFALVFTFATSWYLGEQMHKPVQTMLGTFLIMMGVTICVQSMHADGKEN